MSDLSFHAKDSPEANGRSPQPGERRYDLHWTLEDGRVLHLFMGQQGFDAFTRCLREMAVDDAIADALQSDREET